MMWRATFFSYSNFNTPNFNKIYPPYSKGELMPLRLEAVDLRAAFTEVTKMLKLMAKTGVKLVGTVAPDVPALIMSDRQRVVQVRINPSCLELNRTR